MNLDLARLALILAGTMFLSGIALVVARGSTQRVMILGLLGGFAFYSGIGAADISVAPSYIAFYLLLFGSIILGFSIGRVVFQPLSAVIGRAMPSAFACILRRQYLLVVMSYVLLSAVPLVWPEFRLHLLFAPPAPDLPAAFSKHLAEVKDPLSHLANYVLILMEPFFYVSLYYLRQRSHWIALVFGLLMYIDYLVAGTIGRGDIMMYVALFLLGIWFTKPEARRRLLVVATALFPFFAYGLYLYGIIRIGGVAEDISLWEGIVSLFYKETSFPRTVGMTILRLSARTDLRKYFTWIVTLPLPKLLTGPIEGARINYEVSELVLGLPRGAPGWYVVLPGLVAESIYIYGKELFWIHGLFIGALAAFSACLTERVPQFLFLRLYLVLQFAYVLNRAGISGLLPKLVNEFLLFYLFVFLTVVRSRSRLPHSSAVRVACSSSDYVEAHKG